MRLVCVLFLSILCINIADAQLVYSGQAYVNNDVAWTGINVPHSSKTSFFFINNSVTSVNTANYMLDAGDEAPGSGNNNLDGQTVTGNRFTWNGVNGSSVITHGLFVGYNINCVIKYNYLDKVPYGIIFKSGTDAGVNMTFTSGGCAYNITKNGKFAVRGKGINGVKVYNNTFYGFEWYGIYISTNMDRVVKTASTGWKIKNNIFYSTANVPCIYMETTGSYVGFESDYNVFYCSATTNHEPVFRIGGTIYSWAQWRALGYDAHSVVVDPKFIDITNFVPTARLNYGTNLGSTWETGLSTSATWVVGAAPITSNQDAVWQSGARVYYTPSVYLTVNPESLFIDRMEESTGQFYINSNTSWIITSSVDWLMVAINLRSVENGVTYETQRFSGSAPDIGAFEYMENNASGSGDALVTLYASENFSTSARTATVTITGTNASTKYVSVTQLDNTSNNSTLGKIIKSNDKIIIKH